MQTIQRIREQRKRGIKSIVNQNNVNQSKVEVIQRIEKQINEKQSEEKLSSVQETVGQCMSVWHL
jgi:hypothetical protein